MRVKAALADALWESGNFYSTMAHCREILQLNPNDNQGIRHLLAGYYLELVGDLALLLEDYSGDMRPYLQYTRALLAHRNSYPDADDIAKTAISSNKHIPGLLSKCRLQPKSGRGYITLGEMDEGIDYANNNIKLWMRTPGAIDWCWSSKARLCSLSNDMYMRVLCIMQYC